MKKILQSVLLISITSASLATSYTVTSNENGTTTDGVSLRWAITQASGNDTIKFNISGMAPHTINLLTELPYLFVSSVFIDGTTQPPNGYGGSDPKIIIRDSTGITNGLYCFVTTNAKIKGVWIKDFDTYGIYVFGSYANAIIEECRITNNGTGIYILGSYASGDIIKCTVVENITNGVYVVGSLAWGNIIGSLISNNGSDGVYIFGSLAWCDIEANEIVTNNGDGIEVFGAGAYGFVKNNLISGNAGNGINMQGSGGSAIKGNRIGTDSSGNFAWGNTLNGVNISESNDTIGGDGVGDANTIAFNEGAGVYISFGNGNLISRNSIFCNGTEGITLSGGANNNYALPIILSASGNGATGTAVPNSRVELFLNPSSSFCVNCEGRNYVASVYTDNNGEWFYNGLLNEGEMISATATDTTTNNTSEFSACEEVLALSLSYVSESLVNVFPNPATDAFYINTNFSGEAFLELFDPAGRLVLHLEFHRSLLFVEAAELSRGVYWYKVTQRNSGKTSNGKVILQ